MKKTLSILLIMVMLIAIIPISTVNASSIKFTATPDKTKDVNVNDTITINLKISDINAGELGINTFSCVFTYDENVFEDVKVTSKNNWSITYNDKKDNEQYGTLLAALLSAGVKDDQEIGQITLKVKADAQGKTGKISFTQVASNDGENPITETDKIINVTVKGNAANNGSSSNGNNGNNANNGSASQGNQGGTTTNKPSGSNSNVGKLNTVTTGDKENIKKGTLPQTGYNLLILPICIVVLAIAGTIIYVKYRNINK